METSHCGLLKAVKLPAVTVQLHVYIDYFLGIQKCACVFPWLLEFQLLKVNESVVDKVWQVSQLSMI